MILFYILLLISFLFDGIIPNIFRDYIPLYIITIIVIFSNLGINKKILITLFITGIIYDLTYTNFILIHGVIFVVFYYILNKLLKDNNFLRKILYYYLVCMIYMIIMLMFPALLASNNFIEYITIMTKSIFFNSIYFMFIYVIFCLFKNKINNNTY